MTETTKVNAPSLPKLWTCKQKGRSLHVCKELMVRVGADAENLICASKDSCGWLVLEPDDLAAENSYGCNLGTAYSQLQDSISLDIDGDYTLDMGCRLAKREVVLTPVDFPGTRCLVKVCKVFESER